VAQKESHECVIDVSITFGKVVRWQVDPDLTGRRKRNLWRLHLKPICEEVLMGGGMSTGVPAWIPDKIIG
jgi:hypothetical protein